MTREFVWQREMKEGKREGEGNWEWNHWTGLDRCALTVTHSPSTLLFRMQFCNLTNVGLIAISTCTMKLCLPCLFFYKYPLLFIWHFSMLYVLWLLQDELRTFEDIHIFWITGVYPGLFCCSRFSLSIVLSLSFPPSVDHCLFRVSLLHPLSLFLTLLFLFLCIPFLFSLCLLLFLTLSFSLSSPHFSSPCKVSHFFLPLSPPLSFHGEGHSRSDLFYVCSVLVVTQPDYAVKHIALCFFLLCLSLSLFPFGNILAVGSHFWAISGIASCDVIGSQPLIGLRHFGEGPVLSHSTSIPSPLIFPALL